MIAFSEPYTVRSTPGVWAAGEWVPGTVVERTVYGSLQPVGPAALRALPEGLRIRAQYLFYTDSELVVSRQGELPEKVVVEKDGTEVELEVAGVIDWGSAPFLKHGEYVLAHPER